MTGKLDNQIIKHINSIRKLGEAEDHGLRLRGADSHSHTSEGEAEEPPELNRTTSSAKSRHELLIRSNAFNTSQRG